MGVREETARFRVANRDHVGSGGLSPTSGESEARGAKPAGGEGHERTRPVPDRAR